MVFFVNRSPKKKPQKKEVDLKGEIIKLESKINDENLLLEIAQSEIEKKSKNGQRVFSNEAIREEVKRIKSKLNIKLTIERIKESLR